MTFELRDGTTARDPRLDRLVHFDERSRGYPIRALLGTKPRRAYTWRVAGWLDQGNEGACVGFSIAHEIIARPLEQLVSDEQARSIYLDAQQIDPWPGGEYPGASPRYSGTSVLAGMKIAQQRGHFDEYRWAFGLEDVLTTIGYAGPVILGIAWYEGMLNPDAEGRIKPSGYVAGGHAILANRVDLRNGRVWLHNSWGPGWGILGGAWLTFDDLDRLLHEDGEAVVAVRRRRTA